MNPISRSSLFMKHTLLAVLGAALAVSACAVGTFGKTANLSPEDQMLRHKYRGIYGVVLRLDAVTLKKFTMITSETGRRIDSSGSLALNQVSNLTYTDNSLPIPKAVHATWREGAAQYQGQGVWSGGTVIGDYTVPVAERIPDSILDYIRANGGALRLKIRLKDDGVLIGWDVEKSLPIPGCKRGDAAVCTAIHYFLPGGDFREAQILDGKVMDPGWQK